MTFSVTSERDMIIVQVVSGGVVVKASEYRGHMLGFWHELGKHVVEDVEDRAKAGYERYMRDCEADGEGGFTWGWDSLDEAGRKHWIAAFTE